MDAIEADRAQQAAEIARRRRVATASSASCFAWLPGHVSAAVILTQVAD